MSKNLKVLSVSLAFCGLFSAQAFAQDCNPQVYNTEALCLTQNTPPNTMNCQWNMYREKHTCMVWDWENCTDVEKCTGSGCTVSPQSSPANLIGTAACVPYTGSTFEAGSKEKK